MKLRGEYHNTVTVVAPTGHDTFCILGFRGVVRAA